MAKQESKEERQKWLEEVYGKICAKMSAECDRVGDKIPYIPENGRYTEDFGEKDIFWWTNGFWGGMLWQMYHATGDEKYRKAAEGVEKKMDTALADIGRLYHDVGFMWLHTAVADYRLTGSEEAKNAVLMRPMCWRPDSIRWGILSAPGTVITRWAGSS